MWHKWGVEWYGYIYIASKFLLYNHHSTLINCSLIIRVLMIKLTIIKAFTYDYIAPGLSHNVNCRAMSYTDKTIQKPKLFSTVHCKLC